jgi:hypothetical protein
MTDGNNRGVTYSPAMSKDSHPLMGAWPGIEEFARI